jgi:hypothetical protein
LQETTEKEQSAQAAPITIPNRQTELPSNVCLDLDLGYLGVKNDYPELNCALPIKRKNPGRGKRGMKGPQLLVEQKAFNKELDRERVVVEHTNNRVKKFHIFGDELEIASSVTMS